MNTPEQNRELIRQAGGPSAVGRLFGITGQAVSAWCVEGVPADRVLSICESVAFKVLPHQLRPDIYPHPDDGLPDHLRAKAAE